MPQAETDLRIAEIAAAHLPAEGPLLPILHAVQAEFGHIPSQTPEVLARILNLGKAEVHGVISFYHDFRSEPVSGTLVRICRAEACQATGANALAAELQTSLNVKWHGSTPDGAVTLEPVFCLGLCACGPAAEVGGALVGRASCERVLAELEAQR